MNLDLRKLRYFVAVADRLHFGRAAAMLYISQPALSRQIRQLEQELDVELLDRNSRQVSLTAAGKRLAEDGARLLAASQAAVDRARSTGHGGQSLTVGFMLGMDLSAVSAEFGRTHPNGFVRMPVPAEGLEITELHTEPICVALPAGHPLAAMPSVKLADLADEPVLLYADAHPEWNAAWTFDPRPDGSHPRSGPYVHDVEEIVANVRAGRGVAFLPVSVTEDIAPRGTAFVRVSDVPPGRVVLAWDAERPPRYACDLRTAAHGGQAERDLV